MHLDLMRPPDKTFPAVDTPELVRSARFWNCRFLLSPVRQFERLEELEIFELRDPSLDFLSDLRSLRYLRITGMAKVQDLEPLRDLRSLEVLRLHTLPGWDASGKRSVVTSLDPIQALPTLHHLELFSVVPGDRSLAVLEQCQSLLTVRLQGYPKQEIERFRAATGLSDAFAPTPSWSSS